MALMIYRWLVRCALLLAALLVYGRTAEAVPVEHLGDTAGWRRTLPRISSSIPFTLLPANGLVQQPRSILLTGPDTIPVEPGSAQAYGKWQLRVSANARSFFAQTSGGVQLETSYRWSGSTGEPDGHFSIGVQGGYWPTLGTWNSLPFDIGIIDKFRLNNGQGDDGTVRFGSVILRPNEMFLVGRDGAPILLSGTFSINPLQQDLFEFTTYRISRLRTSMVGVNVPVRWYFGQEHAARPRFFLEAGVGMDLVLVSADYAVRTLGIQYDTSTNGVLFIERTAQQDVPLDGAVPNNLWFSHGSIGAGLAFGRFNVFAMGRFLFSSGLTKEGKDHNRIRGNLLAIPMLAGAAEDPDIAAKLERDGVIPFARTGLSKTDEGESVGDSAELANGVSRFWDPSQWMVGVSFRIW